MASGRSLWMGHIALGGVLAIVLTGCSNGLVAPARVGGTGSVPPALQAWAAFPVSASPRPLVFPGGVGGSTDGPNGVYGDANAKLALLGGAFDRPAHLPAAPATADGFPIISADKAFDLLHPHPGAIAGIRLAMTEARLGKATFGTDRGERTLPAWLFSFTHIDGPIPVLAVAPAAQWYPSGLVGHGGQPYWAGAVVGSDHRTLTVRFIGAQSENGGCGVRYEVKLTESPTAVMVTRFSYPNDSTAVCTLMGFVRHASAVLKAPLGARVLVDDLGDPLGVSSKP